MKNTNKPHKVEVREYPDFVDVYFNGDRFGSVERHWNYDDCRDEWIVFTNTFDSNRPVVDKATGIAYLEALIAMGTS